ncbi:MAG: N-acetylneuraminate synthase [Leptospiraceae bacterium]|nr:N-acetylneuraminate synthase [Leptospiraceae bacterium]
MIGGNQGCYVIAEAGVNHNGSLELAHQLVDVAADAGADAVKFQVFRSGLLATRAAPQAEYQVQNTGKSESQFDMLSRLELSDEQYRELRSHAQERGVEFLASPFDEPSLNFLRELGLPAMKLSSGEVTNVPFLEAVARSGRPVLLSTGMSTMAEVEAAVECITAINPELLLFHCVSSYPAAVEDVNLAAMETLRRAFRVPVGYSDHTEGIEISLAAVALGACCIEKHFTTDRTLPGPDHKASLEPAELQALVAGIRSVEASIGDGRKRVMDSERDTIRVARRSLVAARGIDAGEVLTADMLVPRRPGTGIPPAHIDYFVGRTVRRPLAAGDLLQPAHLDEPSSGS